MKIIIALLISLVCGVGAYAQIEQVSGNISINKPLIILPDTARYQLFKLDYTVMKLDRYTGKTYLCDLQRRKWYLLEVRGGLPAGAVGSTPKYQIYGGGEDSTLLINSETGQTWVYYTNRGWEPVTD